MRIISKFHDYYDGVNKYSQDDNIVFNRLQYELKMQEDFPLKRSNSNYNIKENEIPYISNLSPHIFGNILLFTGKIYPYIKYDRKYHWDFDSFYDDLEILKYPTKATDGIHKLFSFKGSTILKEWSIQNKITIALTDYSHEEIDINPNLSQLSFQKQFDPYSAYQEIEMWIGGVLTNNEIISEISDKDKINQHGFDKWSFRKQPSNLN